MLPPARPRPLRTGQQLPPGDRETGRAGPCLPPSQTAHSFSSLLIFLLSSIKPPQLGRRGWKVPEVAWPSPPLVLHPLALTTFPKSIHIFEKKTKNTKLTTCFRAINFHPPVTFMQLLAGVGGPAHGPSTLEHRAWHRVTRGRPSLKVGGPGIPGLRQDSNRAVSSGHPAGTASPPSSPDAP